MSISSWASQYSHRSLHYAERLMQKFLLLALTLMPFGNATAVVDRVQQQNAICYVKTNAPDLVFGQLPFSCDGKPEKFVAHVKKEIDFLSGAKLIPNFDKCLMSLFEIKNMTNVARGVWDLRDSPVMATNAATASAISDACKIIEDSNSPQIAPPSVRQKNRPTEVSPASLSTAEKALKEKDYATAFGLFKSLAEQGNSEAQANLGLMYELGQGVNQDFVEAFKWYLSAAEQGTGWAQTNLGFAYINGRGTQKDDKEAAKWLRSAALQGNTRAQEVLGAMYNQGRGVPQGHKEAVKWINPSNLMYITKLEKDYRKRVHFESKEAERIVRDFNIDCNAPQKNGHHLPLINLLYARLATADREDMWVETTVQERGGEVRIIDSLRTPEKVIHANAVFQINKWGELHPMGSIRAEAVRNACFDSHGPIWLLE